MISRNQGLIIGLLVGTLTALTGSYKDTLCEPFDWNKFWRSPLLAGLFGAIGSQVFNNNDSRLLLAAFASTLERITVETWKATTNIPPGKFNCGNALDRGWIFKRVTK